jgi:hypothetical protein
VCAAFLGLLAGIRHFLPARIRAVSWRPPAVLATLSPAELAAGVFVLGAAFWLGLIWYYRDVFSVLFALREDLQLPTATLSLLDPDRHAVHEVHGSLSAVLSFILVLAVWRWFPVLERRAADASALRPMKWAILAIAFLAVAQAVLPRRAVWESFDIATFDKRPALVIGVKGEEALLLVDPDDQVGRRRQRVSRGDPGFEPSGKTRALFGEAR